MQQFAGRFPPSASHPSRTVAPQGRITATCLPCPCHLADWHLSSQHEEQLLWSAETLFIPVNVHFLQLLPNPNPELRWLLCGISSTCQGEEMPWPTAMLTARSWAHTAKMAPATALWDSV